VSGYSEVVGLTGGWRKLHNAAIHQSSPDIIRRISFYGTIYGIYDTIRYDIYAMI
jgi:hypothetical protein